MLNQTQTTYKGGTTLIDITATGYDLSTADNFLINITDFSNGASLYKASLNPKTGYENTIEIVSGTTDRVVCKVPASVTKNAKTDQYNLAYAVEVSATEIYKFFVENFIKFKELDV
jgi:hypothetical protein